MARSISVLGAGHGGQGLAAFLALRGYRVRLYNRSEHRIRPLMAKGGIEVEGIISGFAQLEACSTDMGVVVPGAEVVFVGVPASAHRDMARLCARYLEPRQLVVLVPGRTGGALEFSRIVEDEVGWRPLVAETQTFPFVSRVVASGRVRLSAVKEELPVAAFPAVQNRRVIGMLSGLLPGVREAEDVLETGLSNIGAIFHPAPLILNTGRAESTGGGYNHYLEGVSPSVARFMEKLDAERLAVGRALGKELLSAAGWLRRVYGSCGQNLYECLQSTTGYRGLGAPSSLDHRYIWEDVPTGLVPIAELGELVGVPTPVICTTIDMACHLTGCNFWQEGRNAQALGIAGLSAEELLLLVKRGWAEAPRRAPKTLPVELPALDEMEFEECMER